MATSSHKLRYPLIGDPHDSGGITVRHASAHQRRGRTAKRRRRISIRPVGLDPEPLSLPHGLVITGRGDHVKLQSHLILWHPSQVSHGFAHLVIDCGQGPHLAHCPVVRFEDPYSLAAFRGHRDGNHRHHPFPPSSSANWSKNLCAVLSSTSACRPSVRLVRPTRTDVCRVSSVSSKSRPRIRACLRSLSSTALRFMSISLGHTRHNRQARTRHNGKGVRP